MIAIDTSALVAMALEEPEKARFTNAIAAEGAFVGASTLLELHLVLSSKMAHPAAFIDHLLHAGNVVALPFDLHHYRAAATAFERYGKGRGHPAQLNFGDCLAYAVAKTHGVPLLYKGTDFALTDIRTALT